MALTAIQQAAFDQVRNTLIAASDANQKIVTLQANSSLIGIPIKFLLTVENFLKQTGRAAKTVTRINKNIPTLSVGPNERQHLTTEELIIDGKIGQSCFRSLRLFYRTSSSIAAFVRMDNAVSR